MKESVATRFTIDGVYIERQAATTILGVWVGEDPSCWERNIQEIKKRTYATMSMLTKLKYAGLSRKNLLHILEGAARYAGLLLAPAEGFGLRLRPFFFALPAKNESS